MTKKTFLKIHSVDLSQSTKDLVGQIFSSEDPLVPNINQYIRNKEKNELKDDRLSSPLRVEIAIEEDSLSYIATEEPAQDEAILQMSDIFNPLNSMSISTEVKNFVKTCYPEYLSAAKAGLVFRWENFCYILPDSGKSFYIRTEDKQIKYTAQDIFPKNISLAYRVAERKEQYLGFGYYKQRDGSEEIRFEGLEISTSDLSCDRFTCSIDADFKSISVNLSDIPEDIFLYSVKDNKVKNGNTVKVFEWSGAKKP